MAHSKQAEKRNRQNIKNRASNKAMRSSMKTAVRKATTAKDAASSSDAMRKIDKAAKQGVIHKNAAARHKSRLAKKLAKASA